MRPLRADEIEVRVAQIKKAKYNDKPNEKGEYMGKVMVLLYKNARVDMAVLDETFSPENWQRDHKEVKGNLFCGIGVYDGGKGDWVWKWDCGTESFTEREKGEASDSFKRAGFNWGIGRELYTTPQIVLKDVLIKEKKTGSGYELANPLDLWGMYVSDFETEEVDGKNVITKVAISLPQYNGRPVEIYRWEKK